MYASVVWVQQCAWHREHRIVLSFCLFPLWFLLLSVFIFITLHSPFHWALCVLWVVFVSVDSIVPSAPKIKSSNSKNIKYFRFHRVFWCVYVLNEIVLISFYLCVPLLFVCIFGEREKNAWRSVRVVVESSVVRISFLSAVFFLLLLLLQTARNIQNAHFNRAFDRNRASHGILCALFVYCLFSLCVVFWIVYCNRISWLLEAFISNFAIIIIRKLLYNFFSRFQFDWNVETPTRFIFLDPLHFAVYSLSVYFHVEKILLYPFVSVSIYFQCAIKWTNSINQCGLFPVCKTISVPLSRVRVHNIHNITKEQEIIIICFFC